MVVTLSESGMFDLNLLVVLIIPQRWLMNPVIGQLSKSFLHQIEIQQEKDA